VSNTYSRTLLDAVNHNDVLDCLQEAASLLESLKGSLPKDVLDALSARISLRQAFLRATIASEDTADHVGLYDAWTQANKALDVFNKSLTVPTTRVADSFSAKIQQKLASTMPPRPIVELSLDEATGHLTKLFQDSLAAINITDYSDPQSLLVSSQVSLLFRTATVLTHSSIDIRCNFPVQETAASSLRSMSHPRAHIQRHGDSGK